MSRIDGAWIPGNETTISSDNGASGSFVVAGVASAQLSEGWIEHLDVGGSTGDDEFQMRLTISDILGQYLYGHAVPAVTFSHPGCLTTGSHPIPPDSWGKFSTGGAERSEWQLFNENITGTLEVTRVEDGRFWANFEMTAILQAESFKEPDPTQAVNITGGLEIH